MHYNAQLMDYVVVDIEGTFTAGSMWRAIGRYLGETGHGASYRRLVLRTLPGILAMRCGLIDRQSYKNRWLEMEAGLLAGATPPDIERLAAWVVDQELWPLRRPTVVAELAAHHARGRTLVFASGMYEAVLEALAARIDTGPVEIVGTPLAYSDGIFTGRFAGPVCVGEEKAARVRALLSGGNPTAPGDDHRARIVAAYGDTASDVPLLELADEAVAVAPERELARVASRRGWRILPG